jgi:hypothetical protein
VGDPVDEGVALPAAGDVAGDPVVVGPGEDGSAEDGAAVGGGLVTTVASGGAPVWDCTADGLGPDSTDG